MLGIRISIVRAAYRSLTVAALLAMTMTAADAGFKLSLDREKATARLTLRVDDGKPLELTFPSAQMFDVVIRNEKAVEVYRWSRGRMFAEMMQTVMVADHKTWEVPVKLALPAGKYSVEGFLTTTGTRQYTATLALEIK